MKMKLFLMSLMITVITMISCNNANKESTEQTNDKSSQPDIKEEAVTYTADTITANGFVTYDANKEGKRPGVLVVHEWWGLNDYTRSRAKQLAEMGYIAMAVDMYGNA